ncbi:unnamed protein product, partial [Ectocarpus sp. 12 AP-2014]
VATPPPAPFSSYSSEPGVGEPLSSSTDSQPEVPGESPLAEGPSSVVTPEPSVGGFAPSPPAATTSPAIGPTEESFPEPSPPPTPTNQP